MKPAQCPACINNAPAGCVDDSGCLHAAKARIAELEAENTVLRDEIFTTRERAILAETYLRRVRNELTKMHAATDEGFERVRQMRENQEADHARTE